MNLKPASIALVVVACIVTNPPSRCMASAYDPFDAMLGDVESEDDYLELINLLDAALKEPVNLLEADRKAILRLPWVSPLLADRIIALRQKGELRSIDDLKKIDGIDDRMVNLIRPFVIVQVPKRWVSPVTGLVRMRVVSSPASDSYKKHKTYIRSNLEYSSYEVGLVMEKDRDEPTLNDFQAYYLEGRWSWGGVTVGNFTLASGHGLVFSNPYGHSPSTVNPWRFSQGDFGIRPYTSVDENFMLQGVGLNFGGRGFAACFAASRSYFDARLDEDGKVRSLDLSGYHVTQTEVEGEDALREDLLALAARYTEHPLDLRFNLTYADFDREFSPEFSHGTSEPLSKDGNVTGSLDLSFIGDESMFFVEAAAARDAGEAFIGGLAFDSPAADFLMLGRLYDRSFVNLHARPFSFYSGLATGERGLFTRLTFKPVANGVVSVGNDLHRKQGQEGSLSDLSGSESFLDLDISTGALSVSIGEKLLRSEEPPERESDLTERRSRLRSRLDIRYDLLRLMWLRARYENLRAEQEKGSVAQRSSSDLVRLDTGISIGKIADIRAGVYAFSIGDYAARIYQYEPGLPYYPALVMLKSGGSRWYTGLSFRSGSLGKLAVKYARTTYRDDEERSEFLLYYNLKI